MGQPPRPFPPDPLSFLWTTEPFAPRLGSLELVPLMDLDAYAYLACRRDKWPDLFTPGDKTTGCLLKFMTYHALHKKKRKQYPLEAWSQNPLDWPFNTVRPFIPKA